MPHVFISYVSENKDLVEKLKDDLVSFGIRVWLDKKDIGVGRFWKREIRKAIQTGDFFVACFSIEQNKKAKTYMNEELLLAIDELRIRPDDRAWFIPVRFSGEVPDLDIGGGKTLLDIQRVDLNLENWNAGILQIAKVIFPEIEEWKISTTEFEGRLGFAREQSQILRSRLGSAVLLEPELLLIAGEFANSLGFFFVMEEASFDPDEFKAFSHFFEEEGSFYLLINNDMRISQRKRWFYLAHEIGHLLLHRDYMMMDYESQPVDAHEQANFFASLCFWPMDLIVYAMITNTSFKRASHGGIPKNWQQKQKRKGGGFSRDQLCRALVSFACFLCEEKGWSFDEENILIVANQYLHQYERYLPFSYRKLIELLSPITKKK